VTFDFLCPVCESILRAQEEMAGLRIRCPECAGEMEVPMSGGGDDGQSDGKTGGQSGKTSELPRAESGDAVNFGRGKKLPQDDLDMTPMVDVTFLLLIFFMVSAAFALQKSLPIPVPNESKPSTQARSVVDFENDRDYVVVRIDAFNTYHVGAAIWDEEQEAPSKQELYVRLRQACKPGPDGVAPTRMLVVANGEATHEKVVTALDAGTAMRLEEVKLITVEEDY